MGKVGPQMATARTSILGEEDGIIPEPEETEEDRLRYEAMMVRMEEDRRRAIEAGERLPPITVDIWNTTD